MKRLALAAVALLAIGCGGLQEPRVTSEKQTLDETLEAFNLAPCVSLGLDLDVVIIPDTCDDPRARHWLIVTDDGEHVTGVSEVKR